MKQEIGEWQELQLNELGQRASYSLYVGFWVERKDLSNWMSLLKDALPGSARSCVISLALDLGSSSHLPVMAVLSLSPCSTVTTARRVTREMLNSLTASSTPWQIRPRHAVLVADMGNDTAEALKVASWTF